MQNEVFRYCIDCILVHVDMISLYIFSWFLSRSCPVIFVVHWNCIRMGSCCENWHYSSLTTPAIMWPGICCCTSGGCFNVISTSRSCCVEASVRIGDIAPSYGNAIHLTHTLWPSTKRFPFVPSTISKNICF